MLDVKKLLAKVLSTLYSSTWNNLGNGVTYRLHHGVLYISIYGTGISVSTSYKVLGTLPVGFRPHGTYYAVVGFGGTMNTGVAYVNPQGTIGVRISSGSATQFWAQFAIPIA